MRVGLTGSSGFLGQALTRALQENGHETVPFRRPGSRAPSGASISWDPSHDVLSFQELENVGPLDAVVHLAGAGIGDRRWSTSRKGEILNSRVRSTALLVRTLSQLSAKPFLVSASAIGFYGSRGDELLDERANRGQGFLADVCEAWESEARRYAVAGGSVALARTGIVLDRRGGAFKRQVPLFQVGLGGRLGKGQQWVSPISLLDEIQALRFLLDHRLAGTFNLCAPEALRNDALTKLLGSALRRPARAHVPALALRTVLGAEMANELLLASQRVMPQTLLDAGFRFTHEHPTEIVAYALGARR